MKTLVINEKTKDGILLLEYIKSVLKKNPKAGKLTEQEDDWKNQLHLPGKPLTDEQWEEIDKENDEDPGVDARKFFDDMKQKYGWK